MDSDVKEYASRPPHGGRGLKCSVIQDVNPDTGVVPRTGDVD